MGHWDSYSGNRNNFYIYINPSTKKLHFIPWGADEVFEDPGPLEFKIVPKSFKAEGILSRRLWELPAIQERYRAAMRQLLAGPWNESRLLEELRTRQAALQPHSNFRPDTIRNASATHRDLHQGTSRGGRGRARGAGAGLAGGPGSIRHADAGRRQRLVQGAVGQGGAGQSLCRRQHDDLTLSRGPAEGRIRTDRRLCRHLQSGRPVARTASREVSECVGDGCDRTGLLGGDPHHRPVQVAVGTRPAAHQWVRCLGDRRRPGRSRTAARRHLRQHRRNTAEEEAAARDGGQISCTFTIRATLP